MKKFLFTLSIATTLSTMVIAQKAGTLNPNFGTKGIVDFSPSNSFNELHSLIVQPDGKIISVGRSRKNGNYRMYISRHLANGKLDNSFGTNGIKILFPFFGYDNNVFDAKLLDDGKIVLCGYLFGGENNWHTFLAKINPDGSYDESFGEDGYIKHVYEGITITESLAIQDDGKIITVGYLTKDKDIAVVMRYTADGKRDNSFANNGLLELNIPDCEKSNAFDTDIQADGKIVVAGVGINNTTSSYDGFIARINTDGTIDNEFGNNGYLKADMGAGHDFIVDVKIHESGKIFVGGHSWVKNKPILKYNFCMLRINPDGTLDSDYGNNGVASINHLEAGNYCRDFVVAKSGEVYAIADYKDDLQKIHNVPIFGITADGHLNPNFGNEGISILSIEGNKEDKVQSIEFAKDSTLIIGGTTSPSYSNTDIILANYIAKQSTSGIESHKAISQSITVYPNPASEAISFNNNIVQGIYDVEIYNTIGILIAKKRLNLPQEKLNIENLAKGNYIIKLASKKTTFTAEFIKQ